MPALIDVVLPAFFAIFIGYLVGKFMKINMAPVVDLTLYIGVPALVFTSLLGKEIIITDAARIWAAALTVMLGGGLVAFLVFRTLRQRHSGLYIPIMVMNTVNLPFPILPKRDMWSSSTWMKFSCISC